ncbi:cilia- and flagella-associated protein 100-like [Pollicipes pollicipes]|uniref:cilia- and flagella-associated protein 100-like n=1 Tax=Pollicipes pollicipes TaxID=41117 RepID=UPI0018859FA7|nr:cilia- and flagella-associated protein 100-like [Pollicipes pollicipes]
MASGEETTSRIIQRPQMRPGPEDDAHNPFVLPSNSDVFTFRQQDVQNQKEKKNTQLAMPIYKRQYHQPRITARLPPTPEPEDPQVAQDDTFFRKNLAYTRVAMQNKGVERQTLAEFVQNKKDMFFLQYTINVKREQMAKLETTVKEEQERLDRDKKKIEKDYQVFDEFLKENDQMAVEAIRLAEDEAKITMDKVSQIRQVNIQIMATKSFIIKLEERYKELRMYRRFLFQLAPQEWRQEREEQARRQSMCRQLSEQLEVADTASQSGSVVTLGGRLAGHRLAASSAVAMQLDESSVDAELYFTEPQQLFAVFLELEEQNLKLIQNSQETEEALEEMKTSGELTKERISREVALLEQQVGLLQEAVGRGEERAAGALLHDIQPGRVQGGGAGERAAELNDQVTAVYTAIIGENQANISTLQMLASLESHIEDMFEYMETVPPERLHAAEKLRDRERRLKLRELKIRQQQAAQADRLRRTRLRAMAEVVKHTGRPLVFRSRPPTPQRLQRKTQRETEEELEEYNYFFGE